MGTGPGGACELITAPNWRLAVALRAARLVFASLVGWCQASCRKHTLDISAEEELRWMS